MHKEMHWKSLSKKELFRNQWVNMHTEEIALPNGHIIEDYVTVQFNDWIGVIALTDDDHIILVKEYRHAVEAVNYHLPAGIIDEGEAGITAAIRELEEETGYTTNQPAELLLKSCPAPSKINTWSSIYLMKDVCLKGAQQLEITENIIVEKVALSDLRSYVDEGKIVDTFSIAGIYKALDQINK